MLAFNGLVQVQPEARIDHMNTNSILEEIREELAKLHAEHEVLALSHRRLVAKVLRDPVATEQFLGQMAVDRVKIELH